MVRMREEAWSFGISYSNHLKLNSLPVRQSQPNRAIAWRNNDLSIRYIRSVRALRPGHGGCLGLAIPCEGRILPHLQLHSYLRSF
jgi:hypothetical protein